MSIQQVFFNCIHFGKSNTIGITARYFIITGLADHKTHAVRYQIYHICISRTRNHLFYFPLKMHEDMESDLTEGLWGKSHGLPIWRKICFAIGGAPYQITSTVLGFFMSIFLLEVAQVNNMLKEIETDCFILASNTTYWWVLVCWKSFIFDRIKKNCQKVTKFQFI